MWWVGPNEICLFQSALWSCSGYSRMYTHPSCSDAPVWSCSHVPDGKANMLVEQLAKCALPALAFPSVLCKYSSTSQSRRSLSYARVLHSGVLCSTESLSLVYCEETSFVQRRGRRLEAGSFVSPCLFTGGAHVQTSLPGAALSRGGREELRGVHVTRGQLCQVSTGQKRAAATWC